MPSDASTVCSDCVAVEGGEVRMYFRPARGRSGMRGAWCSNSYQARLRTATRDMATSRIDAERVVDVRTALRREFLWDFIFSLCSQYMYSNGVRPTIHPLQEASVARPSPTGSNPSLLSSA
jgi:hypothetical protein